MGKKDGEGKKKRKECEHCEDDCCRGALSEGLSADPCKKTKLTIFFSGLCLFLTRGGRPPTGKQIVTVLLLDPGATSAGLCRHDPLMTMPRGAVRRAYGLNDHLTAYAHWASESDPLRYSTVLPIRGKRVQFLPEAGKGVWNTHRNWRDLLSLFQLTRQTRIKRRLLRKSPVPDVIASIWHLPPGRICVSAHADDINWLITPRHRWNQGTQIESPFATEIRYEYEFQEEQPAILEVSGLRGSGREYLELASFDVTGLEDFLDPTIGVTNLCPFEGSLTPHPRECSEEGIDLDETYPDLLFDSDISAYYELLPRHVPPHRRNLLRRVGVDPGVAACPPASG